MEPRLCTVISLMWSWMQHDRDRADISADDRVVYPISVIASALYVLHQNITLPSLANHPYLLPLVNFQGHVNIAYRIME